MVRRCIFRVLLRGPLRGARTSSVTVFGRVLLPPRPALSDEQVQAQLAAFKVRCVSREGMRASTAAEVTLIALSCATAQLPQEQPLAAHAPLPRRLQEGTPCHQTQRCARSLTLAPHTQPHR